MQCPQCLTENPERARFCEDCGARLEFRCPHCGEAATLGKRFCASCGGSLVSASATPRPAPSPQEYTPRHLAERILTSRAALEGERKQVTVLFADLKGSMELLADRDPEEARAILDPVLERMMEAVHRYEGTVNQVMGDGIMALFGAPLAHEDHAVRACYAALRIQESVKQYAAEIRSTVGVPLQIRIGLNSGEVVVRSIASDLRMDYSAVGQHTNLAARMEQSATPGTILLTAETLRLVEGYVQVKALGPTAVKGLSAPIEVYELLGAGAARSRLQAAATRGLTRFVGRDAELETLRHTLEAAGAGHGQVVALVGEPGVGKSRLVWEFSRSHRTQGWLALESRSVSYGKATSYLPIIDLLKSYCGIESQDDHRRMRQKVLGKVLDLDRALEPALPALLALLDVPTDDPAWEHLDPAQRRLRTLDACKRLLLCESLVQPLLLVFEDLHWIDTETQALLDSLVESLPTARVLLLVNYRPEYEHAWHRKTYYQQLRLDPLPAASVDELLAALLGDAAELQPLKRVLIERTEGNPFFVEESIQTLIESGVLVGAQGSYHLAKPFERTQVPATVQAVLAARIDRLPPEDKRLLQTAAVIGKDVPYPLLQAIAELSADGLRQGLARLQAAEFLYETSLFPELEYTFKHALTQEVAYGSLLHERRRALHARIVETIERLHAGRLAEQAEMLASHAIRGEMWADAVPYLRQAGAKLAARSANNEAVAYLESALAALQHLPESNGTWELAIDIRLDLQPLLVPMAQFERLSSVLQEAEVIALALGDPQRLGRIRSLMTVCFIAIGEYDHALATAHRALAIADELDETVLRIEAHFRLGQLYGLRGEYTRAIDFAARNIRLLEGDLARERFGLPAVPGVTSRGISIHCFTDVGDFVRAIELTVEMLRLAEGIEHPFTEAAAWGAAGRAYLAKGDLEQAIPALEHSLTIAKANQVITIAAYTSAELAYARVLAGRSDTAMALLKGEASHTERGPSMVYQELGMLYRCETYLLVGWCDQARGLAQQVLQRSYRLGARGYEAWALRLHGEIAAHADPPDIEQAEAYCRQALALAEELGMRPLVAHCHLGLGTLYRKIGRDEDGQAELTTAAEMYRAMEMPFWLAKAEAALAGAGAS
jgi:class 3 adenylate cyclase/tetratricopeptide (TPR) repeat protein